MVQALQQQIASKQGQFDELQSMAAQVQGSDARLNNYSSQLVSKYEALKNTARVSDGNLDAVRILLSLSSLVGTMPRTVRFVWSDIWMQ